MAVWTWPSSRYDNPKYMYRHDADAICRRAASATRPSSPHYHSTTDWYDCVKNSDMGTDGSTERNGKERICEASGEVVAHHSRWALWIPAS